MTTLPVILAAWTALCFGARAWVRFDNRWDATDRAETEAWLTKLRGTA